MFSQCGFLEILTESGRISWNTTLRLDSVLANECDENLNGRPWQLAAKNGQVFMPKIGK